MRILAIESAGRQAQVGLYENADRIAESCLQDAAPDPGGRRIPNGPGESSSRQLIPQIQSLLSEANWTIGEIELICLAIGPGSFTGLRIGLVTAKTLCYASGAHLIAVPTLQAIARQTCGQMQLDTGSRINVVVNAHRQQLFCSRYTVGRENLLEGGGEVAVVDTDLWLREVEPGEILTGSGLRRLGARLPERTSGSLAPEACWSPAPAMLAEVGRERAAEGKFDDLWTVQPQYCRPSYAEI